MVVFTTEELESFTLDQLHRLADYYKQPYTKRTSKKKLVELLYGVINPPQEAQEEFVPAMSVRVRRIYDAKKEGRLI